MSYEDAKTDLQELGKKSAGDLIRADDWNQLVDKIAALGDQLLARIDSLEGFVGSPADEVGSDTLSGRVKALEQQDIVMREEFEALENQIQPLLNQYQITLETDDPSYLIGEMATITATVTDLNGDPPDQLLWVDFVASWGKITEEPGFTSRKGMGGDSISVRTNNDGVARIRISSEQSRSLTGEQEFQVSQFFMTSIGEESETVGGTIKKSVNSNDSGLKESFSLIKSQYQTVGNHGMKVLADNYYANNIIGSGNFWGGIIAPGHWNDHRTTVIALVKEDADPTSADTSHGTSSIQINFRDWVGPWVKDYFDILPEEVEVFKPKFEPKIKFDDYKGTLDLFQGEMDNLIRSGGLIERQKNIKIAMEAIDQIGVTDPPPFMQELKDTSKNSLLMQQTMDILEAGVPEFASGPDKGVVMKAFVGQAKGAAGIEDKVASVNTKVSVVEQGVSSANEKIGSVENNIVNLNSRMNNTETTSLNIHSSLSNITNKMDGIEDLDQTAVKGRLQEISSALGVIKLDIENLPGR